MSPSVTEWLIDVFLLVVWTTMELMAQKSKINQALDTQTILYKHAVIGVLVFSWDLFKISAFILKSLPIYPHQPRSYADFVAL